MPSIQRLSAPLVLCLASCASGDGFVSVLADRDTAPADGLSQVALQTRVFDATAQPSKGAAVTVSGSAAVAIDTPRATTDGSGSATAHVSSSVPGTVSLMAQHGSSQRKVRVTFTQRCAQVGFAPPRVTAVGSASGLSLTAGDLDGDGHADVVAEVGNDQLVRLINDGTGTLSVTQNVPAGPGTDGLSTLADLNNDGRLDLVASNYGNGTLSLFLNGATQLTAAKSLTLHSDQKAAVGDINNDGRLDLVAASYYGDHLGIGFNQGGGAFKEQTAVAVPVGTHPGWTALTDLNRDGRGDLIAGSDNSNNIYVALSNADGTFGSAKAVVVGPRPAELVAGDLNSDGVGDVVATQSAASAVSVLLGDGSGGLAAPVTYPSQPVSCGPVLGDLNGDGALDIVTGTGTGSQRVAVMLNHGDGTFAAPVLFAAGPVPRRLATVDLNEDGRLDLVVSIDNGVAVLLSTCQ